MGNRAGGRLEAERYDSEPPGALAYPAHRIRPRQTSIVRGIAWMEAIDIDQTRGSDDGAWSGFNGSLWNGIRGDGGDARLLSAPRGPR